MRKLLGLLVGALAALGAVALVPLLYPHPAVVKHYGILIPPSLGGAPFDPVHGPFYVSATGSDGARGSTDAPWRTFDGARANVRPRHAGMTADIYVYLGTGFYPN